MADTESKKLLSPPTIRWNEKKCLQLIRAFREKPILWDPRHGLYYKTLLKPDAWEAISAVVGMPAEACKNKMSILLSSFRREKSKIKKTIGKRKDEVYMSTWFGFKEMSFLMDKESAHKRLVEGHGEFDDIDDSSLPEPEPVIKTIKSQNASPTSQIEILNTYSEMTSPSPPTVLLDTATTSPEDDEIKSFTNFVASKMRKYSDHTKNAVQRSICDILFKADTNYYDELYYSDISKRRRTTVEHADPLAKQDCNCAHKN